MHIIAKYDSEASVISEKLTFFSDRFELSEEDILELKEKKLITFVETENLPQKIPCQVLVHFEGFKKARIMIFNLAFKLPKEVYEEPFLNKNLIEWSRINGGFWIEFQLPLQGDNKELFLDLEMK